MVQKPREKVQKFPTTLKEETSITSLGPSAVHCTGTLMLRITEPQCISTFAVITMTSSFLARPPQPKCRPCVAPSQRQTCKADLSGKSRANHRCSAWVVATRQVSSSRQYLGKEVKTQSVVAISFLYHHYYLQLLGQDTCVHLRQHGSRRYIFQGLRNGRPD